MNSVETEINNIVTTKVKKDSKFQNWFLETNENHGSINKSLSWKYHVKR